MALLPWTTRLPGAAHADMTALGERLDRVAAVLEAHVAVTAEHGKLLTAMPDAVLAMVLSEVRSAATMAWAAAWATLRRKVFEELSKWAWRGALGYLGLRALEYLHALAGGVHLGGALQ